MEYNCVYVILKAYKCYPKMYYKIAVFHKLPLITMKLRNVSLHVIVTISLFLNITVLVYFIGLD